MNIYDYIICSIILIASIYCFYTDIKRREIEDFVCIIGGILILLLIIFGKPEKRVFAFHLQYALLTWKSSLICAVLTFILFLIIPVGGGDMKFFTFISLYFGFFETIMIYCIANIVVLAYAAVTTIPYARKNKEKLKEQKGIMKKCKFLITRTFPLSIGILPGVLIMLYNIIFK